MPTEMEEYLFDLRGYLVLQGAVDTGHVARLNAGLDEYTSLQPDQWCGNVHRAAGTGETLHLHNVFEMGEAFEALIDHPAWLGHMDCFVGGDGLYIDESFADIRGPGAGTRLHSGAHKRRIRTQFLYHNAEFRCGQINILLALSDVGPGDGATMVVPGSHKSNLAHPAFKEKAPSVDQVEGAVEVHVKAGDAIFLVDCAAHGSAMRINPGQRRILIIRYGPHWGQDRYGYVPSKELLGRLAPQREKIVQPLPPKLPPDKS
jgi:hypothetical protein